ncbi:MAG TPA: hypothetical protein VGM94_11505 [Galbitalea sp.]|jgi:hypothetical protein
MHAHRDSCRVADLRGNDHSRHLAELVPDRDSGRHADADEHPNRPPSDGGVLFTITATAAATGGSNAKVLLTETVYAPTDTAPASDLALLTHQCYDFKTAYPTAHFITTSITSKLAPGSPAWPVGVVPIGMSVGDYSAWSGDYGGFESGCASGILKKIPGAVHGVLPIPAVNSASANKGWARSTYGFAVAWDGETSQIPAAQRVAVSNCHIQLSPAAAANSYSAAWPTHPQTSGGAGCEFGIQTF